MKRFLLGLALGLAALTGFAHSDNPPTTVKPFAKMDGTGDDWKIITLADFEKVNCEETTFTEKEGTIYCTGLPVGVTKSKKIYTNFEMVAEWCHRKSAGNSGFFVWTQPDSLKTLKPGQLPMGVEVQVLDHGYTAQYEKSSGKKADWFTTNGDVFPVGSTKMKPFPPLSPNGQRSFPKQNLSKGINEWNHYYVRAINGEVRLWVNGTEVSGGTAIEPRTGHLCLESEGSPIEFRNIKIRELP
jgi:hypothetical protein